MIQKIVLLQITFIIFLPGCLIAQQQHETKFEQSKGFETVTYQEGILWFSNLARDFPSLEIREIGETDSGFPLHLIIFSADQDFDFTSLRNKKRKIILINNAIHPGEPDGVDASMMLLRNLARDKKAISLYKDIVLVVIPFYNIGGALNRNNTSRVNQNGPRAYGFRGNAQNLDLNRDFIKMDSKNAQTFTRIFHLTDPDVFVDNHVSNGADYQHVMTMLETQPDKLGGALGNYLKNKLMPELEDRMAEKNFNMIPYVNVYNTTPDAGYNQFLDLPRYSSGYTTLFHTLGFVPETHMLKPYKQRVEATYAFLESLLEVVAEEGNHIQQLRDQTKLNIKNQKEFVIDWELDKSSSKNINFKGFEGKLVKSELTGGKRLFYDRNKPFEKPIPFFNKYVPKTAIEKPKAYLLPKGWHKVIDRLKLNEVEMQVLENDTIIEVESYFIEDYKTVEKPYEGHYLHFDTKVKKQLKRVPFIKGDYIIYTDQAANRYLVETLEPAAPDSFFNWNFFDTILQQKEGFSDYVFEDVALNIIEQDAELKKVFDDKKKSDSDFAGDPNTQLNFIYKLSPHYEEAHLLYPVYRLVEN